jgi:cell division protein FtsL
VRQTAAEEQRAARFLRERDHRRLRVMATWVAWSALAVTLVLGVVALKVQQVRLAYRLDALRTAQTELEDRRMRLRVELASLSSLARIEDKARRELGMVPPGPGQVQVAREFVTGGEGLAAASPATRVR